MSILIKGVEMPTGNDEMRLIIHSNGQVIISHKTYFDETEAISVPPHGRLGDLDALKVSLVFAEKTAKWAVPALRAVLMIVDEMPTIIPASKEGE